MEAGDQTRQRPARRHAIRLPALGFYQTIFYVYLTIALLIFTFLVPPFQKNDEPAHFLRSVSLTNLDFVCEKDSSGEPYFPMKRKYADLPDVFRVFDVAFNDLKFDTAWLRTDFSNPIYDQPSGFYRFCNLAPVGYLPSAVGVLVGKPFENPLVSFYSGRVFGALFFVLAIVLALRIVPDRYRVIVYFYAAMPTLLHQVSGISYDAVQLSLFPLLFAYLTKFLVEDDEIKPVHLLIFMGLLWWIINVRLLAYYPILLLFFIIPHQKITPRFSRYLLVTSAFLGVTAITTGFFDFLYLPSVADSQSDGFEISASAQLRFVLNHPWDFVAACYKTMDKIGALLFREGIGIFGWVDYIFAFFPYFIVLFVAGMVAYYAAEKDVGLLRPWQILILFAAILLTFGSLFLSLYAVWTPVGHDMVDGLQGRYFLGLLPLAIFAVSQTAAAMGKSKMVKVLTVFLILVILRAIFRTVMSRYY